ncbi:hypothetical protein Nepgr_019047 [Nepenthes gracilis]|uniref:Uncharacterized protein n=1 Tax=Nepenthes gracilis TaxID=150966 RepID=A0AAD3XUX7_NEPGR|nr:hypothetical protein Nepgr_019047 [Nepenthes gracilis]
MGCTASKLDNEDTVRRCKDRRRLMKEAVYARHHLAAAHADYCRSLRITGSVLADFAANEPLSVSVGTPAVLLRDPSSLSSRSFSLPAKPPPPSSAASSIHPPPPPPPLSPSPTITSSKLPHILSASSLQSRRERRAPKLPYVPSDSSPSSTPTTAKSGQKFESPATYMAHDTYASTPSQASSVWNWENFYPPSPPDSEYFNRQNNGVYYPNKVHHLNNRLGVDDKEEGIGVGTERETSEREEVHCSEWGDHYSTTSSDTDDMDGDDERESRSEISGIRTRSDFGSSTWNESFTQSKHKATDMRKVDECADDGASSSVSWNNVGGVISDTRIVVRHRDLREIVASIKEYFDKAASAGDQVSEMLETGRAQLDRSFRRLKKTVYHSSGVLSNLSSSWTSKPPLAVKYRLDAGALDEPGGPKSLCSTLERLLAWEKKLYEEVKAREGVKIEHEKKLATLQNQEYKGEEETKLDKTKTSIKRLQSLIIVTSQAVNTTSSAIIGLRNSDLVPQLVELCHGLMYMWRSMNQCHEVQNQVVLQVRYLVNRSVKGEPTSELHRQATRDLESAISAWHSSFCRLIKYQRDFIRSLQGWFRLTLIPVDKEANNITSHEPSDAFSFFDEWKLALERVPDTVASGAIKSFANVVRDISQKQTEEIRIKKRTESVSKELEKKASALRSIEKKYYHSYSMVGLGLPDPGPDNGQILDARDPLSEKKSELAACQRRVEDEMLKHSKAVEVTRAMTLNNIQTGLPGVFQAMTSFSSVFTEALDKVCSSSYAIK